MLAARSLLRTMAAVALLGLLLLASAPAARAADGGVGTILLYEARDHVCCGGRAMV